MKDEIINPPSADGLMKQNNIDLLFCYNNSIKMKNEITNPPSADGLNTAIQ